MLVLVVQDVNRERDIPIAPLTLQPGQGVMVRNLAQTTAAARTAARGRRSTAAPMASRTRKDSCGLPIAADWPSLTATRTQRGAGRWILVKVQVCSPAIRWQVIVSGQVIDKFQVATRFYGVDYKPLDPLVSPARGYGHLAQHAEFRRLMQLSQAHSRAGDPVNYAPYYFQQFLSATTAAGPGMLYARNVHTAAIPANASGLIATSGDPGVPVNTGIALARAAGLVEMTQPDPAYGIPVDQVLVRSGAVEGVPGRIVRRSSRRSFRGAARPTCAAIRDRPAAVTC